MNSSIYRRQSMAQLYEKLRAQDDDDDMAWLAQYSPDDKPDEPYVPVHPTPALSTISSASPVSPCSSGPSTSDLGFSNEFSDDLFDFDSGSDVDPELISPELPFKEFDPSADASLMFQPHDSTVVAETSQPSCIPSILKTPLSPSRRTSLLGDDAVASPVPTLGSPILPSRRNTRGAGKTSARCHSPIVFHDPNEDVYSESEGSGSEDEYLPSPALGTRKRNRSMRSAAHSIVPSQRQDAGNSTSKRPRHSSLARNVQATPGTSTESPITKNNPWACPYCKWVQRNHRTPDLKRHIRTHTRLQRPAQWICCGIPVKDAENYNIPEDAKPYAWAGEMMIGGCCKEFSRRDALKRHLDNDHINCIGNFSAFANICEDDE